MPMKRSLYPERWEKISRYVREIRAGGMCEGSPAYPECRARKGEPHPVTGALVVLTVAHLDQDPYNCDLENLRAWCQRCHLTYDAPIHARHAAETRRQKREAQGQLVLTVE